MGADNVQVRAGGGRVGCGGQVVGRCGVLDAHLWPSRAAGYLLQSNLGRVTQQGSLLWSAEEQCSSTAAAQRRKPCAQASNATNLGPARARSSVSMSKWGKRDPPHQRPHGGMRGVRCGARNMVRDNCFMWLSCGWASFE